MRIEEEVASSLVHDEDQIHHSIQKNCRSLHVHHKYSVINQNKLV